LCGGRRTWTKRNSKTGGCDIVMLLAVDIQLNKLT
jgi:hypothetical protein